MIIHRTRTLRTARIVFTKPPRATTRFIYLACHGYGMSVESFARWFEVLPKGHVAACPEGLSRFYWGTFDGPPVASWMTRDERLHEIEDFCDWLDIAYGTLVQRAPQARIILFGFSQGAATVVRWMMARRPKYSRLILWSGTPPEDIAYTDRAYLPHDKLLSLWGDADELVEWSRASQRFDEVGLPFRHQTFAGGHRVLPEPLLALAETVERELG